MARHGLLPSVFRYVDPRRQTPAVAAAVVTLLAVLMATSDDIGRVAQLTNFTLFVAFIAVNASVIRLRRLTPSAERPFRVRGSIGKVPVPSLLGGAAALVLLARLEPLVLVGGVALTAAGLLASLAAVRRVPPVIPARTPRR